jgi:hypothetical protein
MRQQVYIRSYRAGDPSSKQTWMEVPPCGDSRRSMRTVSRPHTAVAAGGRRRSGPFSYERQADGSRRQRTPPRVSGQLPREPALTNDAASPRQPTSRASRLRRSGARASWRRSRRTRPSAAEAELPQLLRGLVVTMDHLVEVVDVELTAAVPLDRFGDVLDQPRELRLVVRRHKRSGYAPTFLRPASPLGRHARRAYRSDEPRFTRTSADEGGRQPRRLKRLPRLLQALSRVPLVEPDSAQPCALAPHPQAPS